MPKRRLEDREVIPSSVFVAFSKRRRGLCDKAEELCTKCGAQIAIVVFSPTGKPFAFGHSSFDDIIGHYMAAHTTLFNPNSITGHHIHQIRRIKDLKLRLKNKEKNNVIDDHEENEVVLDLNKWIEKECEQCHSLQELEFLKQRFLALLDEIRTKLASTSGEDNYKTTIILDNDHYMSTSEFALQNSDFILSGGGGGLHGPVGSSGVGVFDDALNVYPLKDMSYVNQGGDFGALKIHPPNNMSYTNYGRGSDAMNVHPLKNVSNNTDYGTDSGALDAVHPLKDMSYINYGSDFGSLNVNPLNNLSHAKYGSDFGALNVHPLNDLSYTDYGSDSSAFNVDSLNDMYNNYGSDSGALNVDHLNNTMTYNNYGSNSGNVGLLQGNHIQGDESFCFSLCDLLGG